MDALDFTVGYLSLPKEAPKDVITVDDEDSEFVKVRKKNWARLIRKVWLEDPELCPRCGSCMVVLAAISPTFRGSACRLLRISPPVSAVA